MNTHTRLPDDAWGSETRALRCPCLAVDALAALPWGDRMQAYSDYDNALMHWNLARLHMRARNWQWRLDMRRALRFWKHYKRAVRAAQDVRIAA